MKESNIKFILIVLLFVSIFNTDIRKATAESIQNLSTPQLINNALLNGEIDNNTAYLYLSYAFSDYDKLPPEFKSSVPWDGTLILLQLQEAAQTLQAGPELLAVEAVIAGTCHSGAVRTAPYSINESDNFYIEYSTIGGGLTIDDYINTLETTWETEIINFGWAKPPKLENDPLGNKYHVIIQDLGGGLFGYVSPSGTYAGFVGDNQYTAWDDIDAYDSCMVINSDLSSLSPNPRAALEATAAHEFNHAIQFGYGVLSGNNIPDEIFIEGGATWIEDEVFDNSNDNYNFLWPQFNQCMGEYQDYPYSYWITFRGLTEQYGNGSPDGGEQVMQDFWEETSKSPTSNMLEALNYALENKGVNLGTAFHRYAIAVYFNKPCSENYLSPYCFEEGPEYIKSAGPLQVHKSIKKIGGSATGGIADNYAINWINLPLTEENYDLELSNQSSGGQLRASVVCDTGNKLRITSFSKIVGKGESSGVISFNPSNCSEAIVVLTNQSQTSANPTACTLRSYTLSIHPTTDFKNHIFFPSISTLKNDVINLGEIPNWNFEKGPEDWVESSSNGWNIIVELLPPGISTHSGDWLAWLGGDNDETSSIKQNITVPEENPILNYWVWIDSEEECGANLDFAEVVIDNVKVENAFDLCTSTTTDGWVKKEINLQSYAGEQIELKIRVQTDDSIPSSLFLEDFSFETDKSGKSVSTQGDHSEIPSPLKKSIFQKK